MVFRVRRQHSELVSIPAVGRVASPLRSTLLIPLLAIRLVIRTEKQRIGRYVYLMDMTAENIFKFLRKLSNGYNSSSDNTNLVSRLIVHCCKHVPCIISFNSANFLEDIIFISPFFLKLKLRSEITRWSASQ